MRSEPLLYYYNRFRLFLFRSPLLKESIVFFLFLQVLRCFSSLRSLLIHYFTHVWVNWLFFQSVFPHSDISGSMDICSSPKLFAAYHVFLRLLMPRHSPYALSSLTFFSIINFVLLRCSHSKSSHIPMYAPLLFSFRAPCTTCFLSKIKRFCLQKIL